MNTEKTTMPQNGEILEELRKQIAEELKLDDEMERKRLRPAERTILEFQRMFVI